MTHDSWPDTMVAHLAAKPPRLPEMIEVLDIEVSRGLNLISVVAATYGEDTVSPALRRRVAVEEAILALLRKIQQNEDAVRAALREPQSDERDSKRR